MLVSCVVASVRLMNVGNSMEDIVSFCFFTFFLVCKKYYSHVFFLCSLF